MASDNSSIYSGNTNTNAGAGAVCEPTLVVRDSQYISDRLQAWKDANWIDETTRTSVQFIKGHNLEQSDRKWGFVILRTVYSPESIEGGWNAALDKLNAWVKFHFDFERLYSGGTMDPTPDDMAYRAFQNVVVQDPVMLDGASFEEARLLFRRWIDENVKSNEPSSVETSVCLVIDEKSMQSLVSTPDPTLESCDSQSWVLAVEGEFEPEEFQDEPSYKGWMRAEPSSLAQLYDSLTRGCQGMDELCPLLGPPEEVPECDPNLVPLYDGSVMGKLVDP